jgi:hypothetical protein
MVGNGAVFSQGFLAFEFDAVSVVDVPHFKPGKELRQRVNRA